MLLLLFAWLTLPAFLSSDAPCISTAHICACCERMWQGRIRRARLEHWEDEKLNASRHSIGHH
jgi:hypothetical protein